MLLDELFSPKEKVNKDTLELTIELGVVAMKAILDELNHLKKETKNYVSSLNGDKSWKNTSQADHEATMGKFAMNDPL